MELLHLRLEERSPKAALANLQSRKYMHYLIDGYNLLHHAGRLLTKRGANLEAARLDLLRLLHGRFGKEPVKVTTVFDARHAPPNVPAQEDYFGIEVRFTRFEEADDLIEAIIR